MNWKINPIQDGSFQGCSRIEERWVKKLLLPKICGTYPRMMKLGTAILASKRFKQFTDLVTHLLSSANIIIFYRKSANFSISRNTNIDSILKHNFYLF